MREVDFDLHGIVGIRLRDARTQEVQVVTRQLGPIERPLDRPPDIVIQFVDKLELSSPVRLLGDNESGFTDDAFLIFRGKHKSALRVQIPFQDIGLRPVTIVAEYGLNAVPLLIAIVNLTMISKNVIPVHASAMEYKGIGMVVTGWAKSGKSETLLAFAAQGARYVGDEWVYLSENGLHMYGIPEPIRLWKWHFEEMPQYWRLVKRTKRLTLQTLGFVTRVIDSLGGGIARRTAPVKLLIRLNPLLKRQLYVQISPRRLFDDRTAGSVVGTPEKIIFTMSHASPEVAVTEANPEEIAQRVVHSLEFERQEFMSYYSQFRFAFPESSNETIEALSARELDLLLAAFRGKDCYVFSHPYPVSIRSIYDELESIFRDE